MGIRELLKEKRAEILRISAQYGARNIRVFGSVVRGEAGDDSDIDFLVTFDKSSSLMDHAGLLVELEKLLGRKIDVAPDDCLKPRIKNRVLREAVPI
mgnify:CR=1 FL=1